eukprot:5529233-Pleurochrysis_carterae.AAC.1
MSPPFADTKSVFQVRTLNRRARVDTHATTPSRECGDESTHALRGAPRKMAHATAGCPSQDGARDDGVTLARWRTRRR